jgi:oligoribonuclease NrnB/cAMP/cGMP phosphodiesterase (DHH superfamily)
MAKTRTIQIISHGPSCLDGVMAAAAIARFYDGHRVLASLPGNNESDRAIQTLRLRDKSGGDEIWITDLSWTKPETAAHLNRLAGDGARIFWIDHHRTAVSRADAEEFKVPFAGKLLSEKFSAAMLTFDFLKQRDGELSSNEKRRNFEGFRHFAEIADDHDRWIHNIPESPDWALAVQTMGGIPAYREIIRLREPNMSRRLREALKAGQDAMKRSMDLADATLVERPLDGGIRLRSACCFGYSSEVAAHLYENTTRTVIALFDLRSQGVSLRRSPDCEVDLSKLAEQFGGGGHAAASGFMQPELRKAPAERLAEMLAQRLSS